MGPPQRWQSHRLSRVGDISPERRLNLMGTQGLPVGRGSRWLGGMSENVAWNLWCKNVGYPQFGPKGQIIHIFACQMSFDF